MIKLFMNSIKLFIPFLNHEENCRILQSNRVHTIIFLLLYLQYLYCTTVPRRITENLGKWYYSTGMHVMVSVLSIASLYKYTGGTQ